MNNNLLKEAIADADAIKKLAIENAKASLNEAFDSKIKSMLAARLEEEADDLEEKYEEEEESQDEAKKHMKDEEEKEEESTDEVKHSEEEGEADEAFDLDAILAEMEKDGEEEEEEESTDEAKGAEEETEEEEEDEEGMDEEIDLEALLNELNDEEDDEAYMKEEEDEEDDDVKEILDPATGAPVGMTGAEIDAIKMFSDLIPGVNDPFLNGVGAVVAAVASVLGADKIMSILKNPKAKAAAKAAAKDKEAEKQARKGDDEKSELQEIKRQAAELAEKVNETNLINAKLLYLNKILRKYNLSEQQKLKVINAFDKAGTVNEAKIVHESLDQAFSVKNENVKGGIKESIGFASKAAGTSTKRVINEGVIDNVDKQVSRWQKLAGIIK